MRQFGVSPEVFMFKDESYVPKDDEIKMASGAVYKKDPKAMVPSILTYYFNQRKAAKNEMKACSIELEYYEEILNKRLKNKVLYVEPFKSSKPIQMSI